MAFVAIMLFNYANATLFWHCHRIGRASVAHSHIYWKTHTTGDPTGGHTSAEIQIIDIVCSAVYTDDIIPAFHLERMDVLECVLVEPAVSWEIVGFKDVDSLRGPPSLA